MLEKIINSAKHLLFAGLIALAGCSAYYPVSKSSKPNADSVYSEFGLRGKIEATATNYGLSREKRTIPVHGEDGGPSKGGVIMPRTVYSMRLSGGIEQSIGTEDLRFKFGGDIGANMPFNMQELQKLPAPYESYVYMEYGPDIIASPFIGMDIKLSKKAILSLEAGRIFTDYKIEAGHYRYCGHEDILKDSGKAQGNMIRIGAIYKIDDYKSLGIGLGFERCDTLLGDERTRIDAHTLNIVWCGKF